MVPPKVFISYSHDSAEHKGWVLEFATTLRNRGIDAVLDQWDLKPGMDLPQFMEQNLESCDFAIMVCTKKYVDKANAGVGGVGYEKMIMTASSLTKISDNKVIPIIRENCDKKVPTFLRSKLYIDFTKDDDVEYSLDELLRHLLDAPLFVKPDIGKNPFHAMEKARPDRTSDGIKEIMTLFIEVYNFVHEEYVKFSHLVAKSSMNRLKFDKYLNMAIDQGLIRKSSFLLYITDKGIAYSEEHGLVEL